MNAHRYPRADRKPTYTAAAFAEVAARTAADRIDPDHAAADSIDWSGDSGGFYVTADDQDSELYTILATSPDPASPPNLAQYQGPHRRDCMPDDMTLDDYAPNDPHLAGVLFAEVAERYPGDLARDDRPAGCVGCGEDGPDPTSAVCEYCPRRPVFLGND